MKRILFFVLLTFSSQLAFAQARSIAFTGMNEFSLNFGTNTGNIKVERINNYRNGGKSGTLYIQVWLFKSPYAGVSMSGLKLADIQLGQLNGGWQFNQMSYPISWDVAVAAGTYYVSFLLVEYNPLPGGNFWVEDYVTFSQVVTKARPETRDEAAVKLTALLRNASQLSFGEGGQTTRVLSQSASLTTARIEKQETNKSGKIVQEWTNIPWSSLYATDAYESTSGTRDLYQLSLKFDEFMSYTYMLDGKPEATSRRRDLRQINFYIRKSDHAEAVRLINLIKNSYY